MTKGSGETAGQCPIVPPLGRLHSKRASGVLFLRENSMIVVLASIELNSGKRAEFLAEFRQLVPLVLAEKGCLEYFPSVDHATHLPVQGPLRDDVVVVVEKWES